MKRLTERDEFGNADIIGVDSEELQINLDLAELNRVTVALNKLAAYEDLEEQCIKETTWGLRMLLSKWKEFFEDIQELYEYRRLNKQGRLLKLPCEVGDVVYRLYTVDDVVKVYEHRITTLTNIVNIMETGEIGKTVFLTQEAAEAALKLTS